MPEVPFDAAGRRRSPATMAGFHTGRSPRNKGQRYPADPPTVPEIVAVMPPRGCGRLRLGAGDVCKGRRPGVPGETPRTLRIGMPFRALGALALQESAHRRGMSSCCLCPVDNAPCRMLSSLRAHARRRRRELGVGSRCSRSSLRLSRFPRPRSAQ